MPVDPVAAVPPGWVGGFAQSDPAFAYPDPDLSSLPLLGNMDNIALLQRQQAVLWPEFSWLTVPGDEASRAFQMFAPDISRVGYTDEGRIYSIICPQQGTCSPSYGSLNVEVSVTGQRGWVDETARTLAGELTVEAKIWFSPSAKQSPLVRMLWTLLSESGYRFPVDKAHAIRVPTFRRDDATQPVLPLRTGETDLFASPGFAQHHDVAWAVGHIDVEIGAIERTGDAVVDDVEHLVMDAFNRSSGNLLLPGTVLSWNVWFTAPALVDRQEWQEHAEKWRESIDADHGSPDGPGTSPRYFDGSPFVPSGDTAEQETEALIAYLDQHLPTLTAARTAARGR
ncbi:hypothetical protein [Cellulomonas phragmiteti]|uniref:Uncharacterized protein n=1 Tax=Cellulomonas phragmiteti TaxID=478780 RepID=A0ABQ4DIJ4_9CELL|nr:hypothetical protein [Cellulomonas phragmiteti]GIG39175.1 hypothetical protein Cph01nite_09370 [Cellulomonas phragmiteti]